MKINDNNNNNNIDSNDSNDNNNDNTDNNNTNLQKSQVDSGWVRDCQERPRSPFPFKQPSVHS